GRTPPGKLVPAALNDRGKRQPAHIPPCAKDLAADRHDISRVRAAGSKQPGVEGGRQLDLMALRSRDNVGSDSERGKGGAAGIGQSVFRRVEPGAECASLLGGQG